MNSHLQVSLLTYGVTLENMSALEMQYSIQPLSLQPLRIIIKLTKHTDMHLGEEFPQKCI